MKLLLMNNPVLRQVCEPVLLEELDYIKSLIPEMTKIMAIENGVALAANQVGIIKRFFLMKNGIVVINPEIIELGPKVSFNEGCLSIPGTEGITQRAQYCKVRFKDQTFADMEIEYNGIEAVSIQHEIDHLDGKLYTDQLSTAKRMLVLKKHRDFLKSRGRYK